MDMTFEHTHVDQNDGPTSVFIKMVSARAPLCFWVIDRYDLTAFKMSL